MDKHTPLPKTDVKPIILDANEIVFGKIDPNKDLSKQLLESNYVSQKKIRHETSTKRIPKFGEKDYDPENVEKRRKWLASQTNTQLSHISGDPVPTQKWKGNIENMIGTIQVPVGITGPIKINGDHAIGDFYVPLATTEGAIVTTYSIGMRLITQSGGVNVAVEDHLSHISPMFRVNGLRDGQLFQKWIEDHFVEIKAVSESTTQHGKLITLKTFYWDKRIVIQFNYYTADAQGMNMINVATEKACEYIAAETGRTFNVRSNYSGVKKMSVHNMLPTFGKSVHAEATIPAKVLQKLMVTAKDVAISWHEGVSVAHKSQTVGINCQAANGIAAILLACGQDIADISSSHVAYSNFMAVGDDLYIEVYIPSLVIGTVGGGTGFGTQRECLEMMGCYGPGKVLKFAEIIGALVLAGELATVCAVVNGTFVKAHATLGRNKP